MEYSLGWTSTNPSSLAVKCGNMRKQSMGFDSWSAGGERPRSSMPGSSEESWIEIDETIALMLHVWYIYHYLPTFGWFLVHMLVNIPYMEHLGWDFKLQNQSTYPLQRTDVVTWSVETDKRKTCYDVRFPAKHEPIISQLIVKTYPLVNIQKTMEHHYF